MMDWLAAFHFLRPWWLLLALLGPLALWLDRQQARDAGGWRGIVAPHLLAALLVRDGRPSRLRRATVAAMLFPVLAAALAGPSWRHEPSPFVSDRAVMAVALDLSHGAEPALAAGKRKIRDIVAARPGARTGLVAYAGTAHTALPPTDDARLIETYLDALSPRVMPRDGTAASAALTAAFAMLENEPGAGTVVFVTPAIPASEQAAFSTAARGARQKDSVLVLATGPGPFEGAAGATLVALTPDTQDAARVAALAQRHFSTAPSDDPTLHWHDSGPWLALLAVPLAALFARRGFLAALLLALALPAGSARAADGDLGWFWKLWLTPNQRAQLFLDRGEPARAAPLFTDPVRRGVALYRAGDYAGAAAAFAPVESAEAQYDRGNALMMQPQGWNDAIPAYDRALQLRPGFIEARDNRAIAEAFRRQQQQAEADRDKQQTDEPGAQPPDDPTIIDQPQQQRDPQPQADSQPGPGLSDGDIQAMWMRRVGGTPADFLRQRFARETSQPR